MNATLVVLGILHLLVLLAAYGELTKLVKLVEEEPPTRRPPFSKEAEDKKKSSNMHRDKYDRQPREGS